MKSENLIKDKKRKRKYVETRKCIHITPNIPNTLVDALFKLKEAISNLTVLVEEHEIGEPITNLVSVDVVSLSQISTISVMTITKVIFWLWLRLCRISQDFLDDLRREQ